MGSSTLVSACTTAHTCVGRKCHYVVAAGRPHPCRPRLQPCAREGGAEARCQSANLGEKGSGGPDLAIRVRFPHCTSCCNPCARPPIHSVCALTQCRRYITPYNTVLCVDLRARPYAIYRSHTPSRGPHPISLQSRKRVVRKGVAARRRRRSMAIRPKELLRRIRSVHRRCRPK